MTITRLLKMMGGLFSILACLVIFSIIMVNVGVKNERDAVRLQAEFKQLGIDLANASDYLTNEARRYVQFGDKVHYDNYWREVNETQTRDRVVNRLIELNAPKEELDFIELAKKNSDALIRTEDAAMEAVEKGDLELARKLMFDTNYDQNKSIIMEPIHQFQQAMNTRAELAAMESQKNLSTYIVLSAALSILMIVMILITFIILYKKIKPLALVSHQLEALANNEGDLTMRLPVNGKDEIGKISSSFNAMLESLHALIKEVQQTSLEAYSYSKELDHNALEAVSSSHLTTDAIQEISTGVQVQHTNSKELVKVMDEMAIGTQSIAQNTSSVSDASSEMLKEAEAGHKLIQNTVQQIKSIRYIVKDSVDITNKLGERSKEVEQIVLLIQEIANQTNLLALNAAIEAARAGEHGRGFAIVADEVRRLAEQTAGATNNIAQLIQTIQNDSTSSITHMNKINTEVENGMSLIDQTGIAFEKILEPIRKVAIQMEEISATTQQLSASAEEVTASVEDMSAITEESADRTQQVTNQTKDQLERFQEMSNSAKVQSQLSQRLQDLVSRFKL
ncbi:methyl-accepting chemotaxis protein [Caldalkalibacillus mannanilyticus]|uniref:methyl-accepting chemotaxis protein n=1 Tax=Caldalkalibacillus mannanilyticus TaxID=1418 RepID=UPI0004682AF4|nr:methyl-accepting chemotaxis protein [Caldalkalibacillus mannanilyticus]